MDRFTGIMLWAGLGCFALAFLLSGLYPWLITDATEREATILEVADPVNQNFKALKDQYPVAFRIAYPRADECLTDRELAMQGIGPDDPRRKASDEAWVEFLEVYERAGLRSRNGRGEVQKVRVGGQTHYYCDYQV